MVDLRLDSSKIRKLRIFQKFLAMFLAVKIDPEKRKFKSQVQSERFKGVKGRSCESGPHFFRLSCFTFLDRPVSFPSTVRFHPFR